MSLLTYKEVRPWAKDIKQQVVSRRMPPFHARAPRGRFYDDPSLTESEIGTIRKWVDQGSRRGDPADLPPPRQWSSDWQIGEPDLIITVPEPVLVEAGSKDRNISIDLGYTFPRDTWIQAIQVRPEAPKLVHHATFYLLPDEYEPGPDFEEKGLEMLAALPGIFGYSPGIGYTIYAEDEALLIPKFFRLVMHIHYSPGEKDAYDQTSIGFVYANGEIRAPQPVGQLVVPTSCDPIAPGKSDYRIREKRVFEHDTLITRFGIHMHLRGKSYKIRLRYPNGEVETVFDVPRYDFHWQRDYRLREPFIVPKGTIAEHIAVFDNSAANPLNPDPTQTVRWGLNTTDEMLVGSIVGERPLQKPEIINVVNGIAIDD